MDKPLLEATGFRKAFDGVPALRDGQFTLQPGSVHALCGGNGAGKSTFLKILMGIHRRDGGTLLRDGKAVTQRRYEKLIPTFRGPIDTLLSAGGDWSPWSSPYLSSAEPFLSPYPARSSSCR